MSAVTTFDEVLARMAAKGFWIPTRGAAAAAVTAAGATSGFLSTQMFFNSIGSTPPGTLVSGPIINAPGAPINLASINGFVNNSRSWSFGWYYKIGTLNLAATGDQFTHDAATFPLLRTRMGQAAQPVPLTPFLYITTATTVTAPAFTIKNGAGTTGYVNQAGATVVGTKVITLPAAATAVQSGFLLPLEDTDYAIRDIQQINVGTAGSAGAATVYGFEPIAPIPGALIGTLAGLTDMLGESLATLDLRPAVATSGTAVASLGIMCMGVAGSSASVEWNYFGYKNT